MKSRIGKPDNLYSHVQNVPDARCANNGLCVDIYLPGIRNDIDEQILQHTGG